MQQDDSDFLSSIPSYSAQTEYLSFYSSYNNRYTTNPKLMLIPIDDHLVHRGDGVFEAFKLVNDKIYLFDDHMSRLQKSSQKIGIKMPKSNDEIKQICLKLKNLSSTNEGIFRLYLSRGPGKFSTNPYDSIGAQIYLVFTKLSRAPSEQYTKGANLGLSHFIHKEAFFAQIKSCNYLLNVLMKKEAVERNLNFTVTLNTNGYIAEGSTENICLVNKKKEILYPSFKYTLEGTTLKRLINLSPELIKKNIINGIFEKDLTIDDIKSAEEIFMIGTTLDALPITSFDGSPVGKGIPGPISLAALNALLQDQK